MKTVPAALLSLTLATLALGASSACRPVPQSDVTDRTNMLLAAFPEVARTLGAGVVMVQVKPAVADATGVEQRFAAHIGAKRGGLESTLKCERVTKEGPERCELLGADRFVEVPKIERKGPVGIVTLHVYEVVGGELGEAVWQIEVAWVDGQWQFSRTIEVLLT